jgi:hypothetical protein
MITTGCLLVRATANVTWHAAKSYAHVWPCD